MKGHKKKKKKNVSTYYFSLKNIFIMSIVNIRKLITFVINEMELFSSHIM